MHAAREHPVMQIRWPHQDGRHIAKAQHSPFSRGWPP